MREERKRDASLPRPRSTGARLNRRELLAAAAAAGVAPFFGSTRSALARQGDAPLERQPISVFSKQLQFLDYPALAETVAEAGLDGIDLTVRPGGHVEPARVGEQLPRAVGAARSAGLQVPMITTAITSAQDPHAREVLSTAAGLGVGHYRMGYERYGDSAVAETIETLAGRWRELAALNEELGIRAGYQNHDGTLVGAAVWDLWLILDRVRSPWLGCQYDIRHAVAEGARSWVRNLEMLAPYVHTLVVKDFVWTQVDGGWRARDVPAGEGMVDLGEWRRQLESAAVAAPISLHYEYLPVDDPTPLPERRRHLLEVLKRDFRRLRSVLAGDG